MSFLPRVLAVAAIVLGAGAAYAITRPDAPEPLVANLWVDTAAGDGSCRYAAAPIEHDAELACDSLREAYEAAPRGGTVRVRPGRYPDQFFGGVRDAATGNDTRAAHDGRVTFIGNPSRPADVKIRRLHFGGDGVTIDGFDVDTGGENPGPGGATLEVAGTARDVTVRNSRIGNVDCQKGALVGGDPGPPQPEALGLVFDNVVFHDVLNTDPAAGCHNECIKVEAQAITIRNSTFDNCATMSVSMGRGDTYGMQPYCCVVFENNVVGHNTDDDGWHAGANLAWFVGAVERVRIVNNTFERGVGMAPEHIGDGPYSGVIANNVGGGWACLPGVTYSGNVGTKCGESDVEVSPYESDATLTAPFGWTEDLHLTADSPAIDAADPEYAPPTDRDGNPRNGAPDAGAYEFGG
jgi:hypothetical protein